MNCPRNAIAKPSGGDSRVAGLLVVPEPGLPVRSENLAVNELVLEEEMIQRAKVITEVLARMIDHPAAPRHWGLNE